MIAPRVLLWCLLIGIPLVQVTAQTPRLKPLRNHKLHKNEYAQPPTSTQTTTTSDVPVPIREKPVMLITRRNKNRTGPRIQRPQRHDAKVWYPYLKRDRQSTAPVQSTRKQGVENRPKDDDGV